MRRGSENFHLNSLGNFHVLQCQLSQKSFRFQKHFFHSSDITYNQCKTLCA